MSKKTMKVFVVVLFASIVANIYLGIKLHAATRKGSSLFSSIFQTKVFVGKKTTKVVKKVKEVCGDGIDNDRDGKIDCKDSTCMRHHRCSSPYWKAYWGLLEICNDGIDNNNDGQVDCADRDCRTSYHKCKGVKGKEICTIPDPSYGVKETDDDGDNVKDSKDPDCFPYLQSFTSFNGFTDPPKGEVCWDEVDNDADDKADCDDPDCDSHPSCNLVENCWDAIDNDGDDKVDCDDPDCRKKVKCRKTRNKKSRGT